MYYRMLPIGRNYFPKEAPSCNIIHRIKDSTSVTPVPVYSFEDITLFSPQRAYDGSLNVVQ